MAVRTSRIRCVQNTDNGFALYLLEMFTTSGAPVGDIVLRVQMVDGQPDQKEKDDLVQVLQREATRRGYPVALD
jgi:hypothetical protein